MDEPFSRLDLLMLEKTSDLIQKVSNMDELKTIPGIGYAIEDIES